MRWSCVVPDDGEKRIVSRFLFLPLSLHTKGNNKYWDTRWLEYVKVEQAYVGPSTYDEGYWADSYFVT